MGALQYVDQPGYAAILFRRTYSDLSLPGALMDLSHQWLRNTDATWNAETKTWRFPSGASLTFGYLDTRQDHLRYQSAEFQFLGFDELTQFESGPYLYLHSRLRRLKSAKVPLRVRGATNPGGIGHMWVKDRFLLNPEDRVFTPALLTDNPSLDQDAYREALEALNPVTRAQLRDGEWIEDSSGLVYSEFSADRNLIDEPPELQSPQYVLGLDFGYNDETAFCILAYDRTAQTVYVLESEKHGKLIPSAVAERIQELQEGYRFARIIGDSGGIGKAYIEECRQRFGIPIEAAQKQNKASYIRLLNDAFARKQLLIVRHTNRDLAHELSELPWKNEQKRDEHPGSPNHLADSLLYGFRECKSWGNRAKEAQPKYGTAEYTERMLERFWKRKTRRKRINNQWDEYEQTQRKQLQQRR